MEFNIDQPTEKFTNHLNVPFNDRIIFSGPFGTGKTYFLEKYFDGNPNYNVIHLFPVNYSVASNEDIFEIIKYDILLELMKKDITFDKTNVPYLKTLLKYSLKNLHQLIAPIAYAVPYLGKEAYEMYDKYQKLSIEYFKEHDGQQVDVEKEVQDYLSNSKDNKGSIIESDYYTNLVCNFVNQLKIPLSEDKKCETVLIIDDLDRIDPDHIFRILNVLSAHMDVKGEVGNKFNFDKIILVFDQQNVHKIFQNRYGSNVDFSGYIDKFYSYKVFDFENNQGLSSKLIQCLQTIKRPDDNTFFDFHTDKYLFGKNITYILTALINSKRLTIRRLQKVLEKPFIRTRYSNNFKSRDSGYYYTNLEIVFIAEFLLNIYGSWTELYSAIIDCVDYIDDDTVPDHRLSFIAFCMVILDSESHKFKAGVEGVIFEHPASNQSICYKTQPYHDMQDGFICPIQSINLLSDSTISFEDYKYFPILIETLKKMESEKLIKLN
jgi:hypothetical protein